MSAAAPQLTSEVVLARLTDRVLAMYAQTLEYEDQLEFRSMQRLIQAMAFKLGREFSELVKLLNRNDPFLDFWIEFEDDLKNTIAIIGDKMTLGSPEIVERVKGLLMSYARLVKTKYGIERAAIISTKMKEFESRRMAVGRK